MMLVSHDESILPISAVSTSRYLMQKIDEMVDAERKTGCQ